MPGPGGMSKPDERLKDRAQKRLPDPLLILLAENDVRWPVSKTGAEDRISLSMEKTQRKNTGHRKAMVFRTGSSCPIPRVAARKGCAHGAKPEGADEGGVF